MTTRINTPAEALEELVTALELRLLPMAFGLQERTGRSINREVFHRRLAGSLAEAGDASLRVIGANLDEDEADGLEASVLIGSLTWEILERASSYRAPRLTTATLGNLAAHALAHEITHGREATADTPPWRSWSEAQLCDQPGDSNAVPFDVDVATEIATYAGPAVFHCRARTIAQRHVLELRTLNPYATVVVPFVAVEG